MTTRLAVLLSGQRIGTLTQTHRIEFRYHDEYLSLSHPTPLSLAMPVQAEPYLRDRTLPWLDGLLPDRIEVRRRWAQQFGVSDRNPVALMTHMGRDCPGAVQLCPESELEDVSADRGELMPLSEDQLGRRIQALRTDGDSWTVAGERWSLGGAQAKIAVVEENGRWYEAHGSVPTTHIIKPGVVGFAAQGLVEHVCMSAARSLGVTAAPTRYLEFDGQGAVIITRYDRISRGGKIIRVHQEDLCQALSVPAAKKYETDGGPSASAISDLLLGRADPDSHRRFVEAVALNYLLGASDGHAKNYAVLLSGSQVRLAPLYDLASSLPYDPIDDDSDLRKTAMAIGGARRYGQVTRHHWERFARRTGAEVAPFLHRVGQLAAALPDAIASVLAALSPSAQRDQLRARFLDRLVDHLRPVTKDLGQRSAT
ncbi:type II toxin-antitoxin system HipA family toxin [Microlunatus speluncae]|uniref:type II toxin-antitoxin system HipA family toxin n=1 Tax=Microlunatus speluncae TaxID=2594267 RepID=UPI001375C844|nr:type II toxin-antitoxin system HipA family toxin [Microlunatus speluncae]